MFSFSCTNARQEVQPPGSAFTQSTLRNLIVNNENDADSTRMNRINTILNSMQDSATFKRVSALLLKSFSDANSPYRKEDFCISILQIQLEKPWYTADERAKLKNTLSLLWQNCPGNLANDFVYYTPTGSQQWMHEIKTPRLLLFFYNPGCEACKQSTAAIIASELIRKKIRTHELAILAIYIDKDTNDWLSHLPALPVNWIHGRDDDEYLHKKGIYDLRAIPTIYLLDEKKKVILKDCIDVPMIEKNL
jgi:hypothetical protein